MVSAYVAVACTAEEEACAAAAAHTAVPIAVAVALPTDILDHIKYKIKDMKIIRLTAVAFLLAMCQSSFAQYDGDGYYHPEYDTQRPTQRYSSYHSTSYIDDYEAGWCNFYGEYSPLKQYTTAKGAEERLYNTATIGFSYNYVIDEMPLTLEVGFEASGSWFSERNDYGIKTSLSFYSAKIPFNIGLRFPVAEGFWIVPYGGINVKWNIYGEERETDADGHTQTWKIFSGDYMYDNEYNRWQLGYQAGLKLVFGSCIYVGAAWKADITSFCTYWEPETHQEEKERFRGFAFSLGYIF